MKYCTNCGTQLSDDAKFCSVCGTKQEPVKAPAKEPTQPQQKKPATPPRQTQQKTQSNTLEGNQEEFFTASDTAGEVVLSSWENPKPKAEASATGTQYQQQAAPSPQPPRQSYQQPSRQNYQQSPRQNYQQPPQQNYQQAAAPQKKKRGFFSWLIIIFLILMILYFLASILEGCKNINLPPDPGTPEPSPHEGVFVSGNDTLFFNGDGKTVSWHFAHSGSGSGTYTFIFGHGPSRYDVAEKLVISDTNNKDSRTFLLKKPAADSLIQIQGEPAADFKKLK